MTAPITPIPDALDDDPMVLPGADQAIEPAPFPGADEDPLGGDEDPEKQDAPGADGPADELAGVTIDALLDNPRGTPLPM